MPRRFVFNALGVTPEDYSWLTGGRITSETGIVRIRNSPEDLGLDS